MLAVHLLLPERPGFAIMRANRPQKGPLIMIGIFLSVIVNALAFYGISKTLPGFRMKTERAAVIAALAYCVLGTISGFLGVIATGLVAVVLAVIAFIPLIGPLLAGAGALVSVFVFTFGMSVILLILIDKFMDEFEMDSPLTAVVAAVLLGVVNVGARLLLPGL
jgi:uncharacterized membrane protein YvlD (DUF360 family)